MRNPRYWTYRIGGWFIALQAVSRADANAYRVKFLPDAEYVGEEGAPPTATVITTPARDEQIHTNFERWMLGY